MRLTPVKTPKLVKWMFPNYIWNIPTTSKTIYLTFDDGPTPEITNWTLTVLKQYQAKATFFCIGNNIKKHPEIFENIIQDGHAIGNHTYNHLKGWKSNTRPYLDNIKQAQDLIEFHAKNQKTKFINTFRPPYGQITLKQGKQLLALNYKIIMWDVLSFDWQTQVSPETCFKNIISKTTNGSIVVFHDSVKASRNMQYALPKMLEYFSNKGYVFQPIN